MLDHLKANNRAWAARMISRDADFFTRLRGQQTPDYLWIGCSDSRVPATQIVDLDPGQIFVHRNVANLAPPQDANYLSVLQFSVDVLKVKHIIVVGHYGCGGVSAPVDGKRRGLVDHWLHPIREVWLAPGCPWSLSGPSRAARMSAAWRSGFCTTASGWSFTETGRPASHPQIGPQGWFCVFRSTCPEGSHLSRAKWVTECESTGSEAVSIRG